MVVFGHRNCRPTRHGRGNLPESSSVNSVRREIRNNAATSFVVSMTFSNVLSMTISFSVAKLFNANMIK